MGEAEGTVGEMSAVVADERSQHKASGLRHGIDHARVAIYQKFGCHRCHNAILSKSSGTRTEPEKTDCASQCTVRAMQREAGVVTPRRQRIVHPEHGYVI